MDWGYWVFLLSGLALGAVLGWMVHKAGSGARIAQAEMTWQAEQSTLQERLRGLELHQEQLQQEVAALRQEREFLQSALREEGAARAAAAAAAARLPAMEAALAERSAALADLQRRHAELAERLEQERRSSADKLALLDEARQKLADAFQTLSADALRQNNQSFLTLAGENLKRFQEGASSELEQRRLAVEQLVQPIRESLAKVDGKLADLERERLSAYSGLKQQLTDLAQVQIPQLRAETQSLVKALRQPAARGRWGEMQLKRVVEMAGMLEHCDFVEQESSTDGERRQRPDLVVRLPGGKQIVVDAKVPLDAYLEASELDDEPQRKVLLRKHAQQLRNHLGQLGRKAYWEQFQPSPEFVVLFVPGEVFFSAALQEDPSLIEYGVDQKVITATPTTLIALLRAASYGWRQEALARNAAEVADLGRLLYERIATLAEHWTRVGKSLGQTVEAYNKSVGALEGRVLVTARRFRDLRAAPADAELSEAVPVERSPRILSAPELLGGEAGASASPPDSS